MLLQVFNSKEEVVYTERKIQGIQQLKRLKDKGFTKMMEVWKRECSPISSIRYEIRDDFNELLVCEFAEDYD